MSEPAQNPHQTNTDPDVSCRDLALDSTGPYGNFVDAAATIVGSDAASVQVFDDELGGLRLMAWRGFDPVSAAFWKVVVPESASTCGMALVTGERVVVPDLEADAALAGSEDLHEYRRSGLRAVQSTPLVAEDGRVAGMLSTHWRIAHEPSAAELTWIDSLARRCALALQGELERPPLGDSARTHPLHEVNARIREMAVRFESTAGDDSPQLYICECGCGSWVALTDREFDATLAKHRPVTVRGHIAASAQAAREASRALRDDAAALRAEALQRRRKSDELANRLPKPDVDAASRTPAGSFAAVESHAALAATPLRDELGDVAGGIEALFDAHAAGAIDLCPTLQRLLLDLLSGLVE